ncbi:hypothetical protein J4227_03015 [Candidatus Woesearchaeota archaeon]|nr:hypothetical protein [Candidatus Woesearchaeota archaeon]
MERKRILIPLSSKSSNSKTDIPKFTLPQRLVFNALTLLFNNRMYHFDDVHELNDYLAGHVFSYLDRISLKDVLIENVSPSGDGTLQYITLADPDGRSTIDALATLPKIDTRDGLPEDKYEMLKASEGLRGNVIIRRYEMPLSAVNYIVNFESDHRGQVLSQSR